MAASTPPLKIFYAYANEDQQWQERLERQLITLQQQGLIVRWQEGNISAGATRQQAIQTSLETADLILLLLSADFLASSFYRNRGLDKVLERHRHGKPRIIPILLRPVDLTGAPLSELQRLPRNGKPISRWPDADEALLDVAQGIRAVIEGLRPASSDPVPSLPGAPRSRPIWNVPYRRNPFFTGRKQLLAQLRKQLTATNAAALTQAQAISGLGGIGKTQTALEYAYRYREEYRAVFWVSASSRETLLTDLVGLAGLLDLPLSQEKDQTLVIAAVKRWLADNEGWLLILDNADDVDAVEDLLPEGAGHILLTTREQALGTIAQCVDVETMDREEGMLLVLRRAKILAPGASMEQVPEEQRVRAAAIVDAMDGLPLALDQAGAYIEETKCGLSTYIELYQKDRTKLLNKRGKRSPAYPHTVATTWKLSFEQVEQKNPAAADLLRLCAFLDPDAIPEDLLTEGVSELGPTLGPTVTDPFKLNEALNVLRSYSLIRRNPETGILTIHRLVQAVLIDGLAPRNRKLWARRAIQAVNQAFPAVDATTWAQCQRYLPHALACIHLIENFQLFSPEAADLLNRMGWYLHDQARYTEAEPLFHQSITIYEQTVGPEHPDLGGPLNNLSLLYHEQGRYQEAGPLFLRALAIQEKVLGPEHPETAITLGNLGLLHLLQSDYQEAEPLLLRALVIKEKVLGPEHPETATTLDNLAAFYQDQDRYLEAESLFLRALVIKEKAQGPEHPQTAITLFHLARLYQAQGRYQEAEPLLLRALVIYEKGLGSEHPYTATTLDNLAVFYQKQDRYPEAEALFLRALTIREKAQPEHPQTGITLFHLARLYQDQGHYEQAETLYQRVLRIDDKVFGPDHTKIAVDLEGYAGLLREMDRDEEAEPLEERARAIRAKQPQ